MPRREKQKAKIIALLEIFEQYSDAEHRLTVPMLEERLRKEGIPSERKSIYTDIAALQDLGYDIELARGYGGGYYLENRDFELAELEILVDAVQNSRFITERKSNLLIKKLSKLTSAYKASSLARQVFVSGRVKSMNESVYYNVDALHQAIAQNQMVQFTYWTHNLAKRRVPRTPKTVYNVSPWALAYEGGNYYLIAYQTYAQPFGMRHYRVDKMSTVTLCEAQRLGLAIYAAFDLAAYTKKMFGMYSGTDARVTLRCDNYYMDAMIDRFGKNIIPITEGDNAHFHFDVPISVSPQFFGWVAGFAGGVEIIQPAAVRTQMKHFLQTLAAPYAGE